MTQRLDIPNRTRTKLDEFRQRVWTVKIIEGLCAAAFGLLLSYLLVFIIDRFVDTPAWLRWSLLIAGSAGLGILFPLKCHKWIWRTRRFDQLARLLKHKMPRLSDRMLGIIELAESDSEQQRSAALCEAALQQVDDDIKDTSFADAVPYPRHRAWAWAAAVPCAIAVVAMLVVPSAGFNALQRWLAPWSNTERYTFAQLDQLPEKLYVPYSEDFTLGAKIAEDSAWTPKQATARIGKQPPVEVALESNEYQFNLPPQKEDGVVQLSVGDARKSIPVEPKLRPELTELLAEVELPDYLQYGKIQKDARGGTLSVVRGSKAKLFAKTSRTLKFASLNGSEQAVEGDRIRGAAMPLEENGTLELSWRDEYELTPKQPFKLNIQANDDMAPTIVCSQLSRQQVVMVDQVLMFEVNADDDFGVKEIGIQWQGLEDPLTNPTPSQGEAIITAGEPELANLKAQATFCPSREGIPPQTLQVRLYAVDYYPTRERVYSPPYTMFVLSQQDHANWLTEQFRRWSRSAQQVHERENQLYEENKALRALPKEELGKKDTRDRLESQAAAESANARQLNAVSNAGKQLIKEATKNDQFNVMTIEGLAAMVKTLDELAKSRMPSVADLLKSAAEAPSNSAEAKNGGDGEGENSDQPKPPTVGNNRDPNNKSGQQEGGGKKKEQTKQKPSISDIESSMNQPEDDDQQGSKKKEDEQPPGEGKFGLPSTTILGGGPKPDNQPEEGVEEESLEEELDKAIDEQENLLEEFTKIAEELQRILDNLEGSTFVKRLKAASRRQLEVADDLNESLASKFGRRPSQLELKQTESTQEVAEREGAESQNLGTIKSDLEAYYSRVQQGKFRTVIVEMERMEVPSRLEKLSGLVNDNLHGQSIAHAEFWADTFDRWAEQLVGPG